MAVLSPRAKPSDASPNAMRRDCSQYARHEWACQMPKSFSRMAVLRASVAALARTSFGNVSASAPSVAVIASARTARSSNSPPRRYGLSLLPEGGPVVKWQECSDSTPGCQGLARNDEDLGALGGGLRPPSDGRRAPAAHSSLPPPQGRIAPAKPALGGTRIGLGSSERALR